MALQAPFFGKRETDVFNPRHPNPAGTGSGVSPSGSASSTTSPSAGASLAKPAPTAASAGAAPASPPKEGGSKLTVGPNIKLKGVEITDCDTLVVEGLVEATMDSRVIQIAEHGAFKGSAEIDFAEIRGEFDGNLTVREKLMIYATGKVTGKIRYGKVVIEEGGQLAGEIQTSGLHKAASSAGEARTSLAVAAA